MKRNAGTTIFILLLCLGTCFGRSESLANEDLAGLYARSIEQVLRLEPAEVDLGIAALIISEQWSDVVPGRRYQNQLNDMAYEIRSRLQQKGLQANYKAIAVINEYLFEEEGFRSVAEATEPDDLFLHKVLDNKRGYCLSLSVLYLALGERLGLPVYGVVVPGHFFVRYDDGRLRFNIETTSKGATATDQHYIDKFKVPVDNLDNIYMANLNKVQTLGCFFNNLGNSYSEVGDIESATRALEKAVKINPTLAEAHLNLGNMYLQKERLDDAIYQYRKALRIQPDDAKVHNNMGNAYTKKGWLTEAISEYKTALAIDVSFLDAYKNLASAYLQREQFGLAESSLKQAIGLKPNDGQLYNQLGNVCFQQGYYEDALLKYEKSLKLGGDAAQAYYGMGICYNKLGRPADEIKAYKKALAIKPQMVAALMNLGNVYFGQEKYAAAIEQYNKAAGLSSNDSAIFYNLGAAYANSGKYEQAALQYENAIEIAPKMTDAHNGLAFVLYKLKDYEAAWRHIQIAEKLGADISLELLEAIEEQL
jgi:tetratricopeptide (TPR) repeat protein